MNKLTKHQYLYLNRRIKKAKFYIESMNALVKDVEKVFMQFDGKDFDREFMENVAFDLIWNGTSLNQSLKMLEIKAPS